MTPKKILKYLHEHGPTNTFKLSTNLKIDRVKLISLIEELAKERLVKLEHGTVIINIEKKKEKNPEIKKEKSAKPKKTTKKHRLKDYPKLKATKRKVFRLENKWLKKEKKLKKGIENLQIQRNSTVEKLAEERKLLNQIKREKTETEKNLVEWEKSLKQREESIQKREESILAEVKRLKRKKERISKAKVLKKDIDRLEATLDNLKKRINIEKRKLKIPKGKRVKLIPKRKKTKKVKPILKPIRKESVEETEVSNIETEKPKITANDILQPVSEENIKDNFHNLIEQEISFLRQKRIQEARNIHLQIKDMIGEIKEPDQRRAIIKDWNRIKEFC